MNRIVVAFLGILLTSPLFSQTTGDYRSNAGSFNWTTTSSWQRWDGTSWISNPSQGYPGQNSGTGTVTIRNGHTVSLDATPSNAIGALVVGQGTSGILQVSGGAAKDLSVSGDLTINSGGSFTFSNSGTLNIGGTSQVIGTFNSGNSPILNFSGLITNTGTWNTTSITPENRVNLLGGFSNSGSCDVGGMQLGSNTVLTANANINIGSGLDSDDNATIAGTADVNLTGDFSNFGTVSTGNLTISGNVIITSTRNGNVLEVTGDLIVNGSLIINSNSNNVGILVNGNTTIGGTFTDNFNNSNSTDNFEGLVTITSSGVWNTSSITSAGNLIFEGGISNSGSSFNAGSATFNTNNQSISGTSTTTFANSFVVTGITVTNSGILSLTNTGAGALQGSGTFAQGTGGFLNYSGTSIAVTTFLASATDNTVIYLNGGSYNLPSTSTNLYYNLEIATGGTKTRIAQVNILGNLTISGNAVFNLGSFDLTIGGDWINSSMTGDPLGEGTNRITFNGTSTQNIINSGDPQGTEFYDVTINNTTSGASDVILNGDVIVTHDLTLTDGIVITSSLNSFTLNPGATLTLNGTPQDNSFIDGPLIRGLATSALTTYIFPIGKDGTFHRIDVDLDQNLTTTTYYTAEVFNSSAGSLHNIPSGIERVSGVRYYNVSQSPSTTMDGANITIYYGADDGVDDPPTLTVVKQNGTDWIDLTGSVASGAPTGSIISGTFTSFSDFALASTSSSNPLPIELLSFNAKLKDGIVYLDWATSSEKNNDFFTIEKTRDFNQYEIVAEVQGAGNSSEVLNYKSEDKHPDPGITYYRLKQTDYDGAYSYSKVISVENNNEYTPDIILYPNPATQYVNLQSTYFYDDEIKVNVYNNAGKLLLYTTLTKDLDSQFSQDLDLNDLAKGIYIMELTSANHSFVKKLMVK